MALDRVPVIDIRGFESGRADAIAREVDEAFRNIGFMTIVGHGVPQQAIEHVDRISRQFFHLPVNEKIESKSAVGQGNRGYVAEGVEAADEKPDLKESFAIGRIHPPKSTGMPGQPKFEPNIWPARPPDFRSAFEEYYKAMEQLAFRLIAIYERALKLSPGHLATLFSEHASIVRVHHYPAQKVAPLPGQIRIGAHTDYGAFTILKVKKVPGARGFQVLTKQKEWIDVEPHDDSFLINIGDLMMTWTNDKWQSNLHRVINPTEESENVERFSVPYFAQPNYDALIQCISSCLEPGEQPKYEPISAGAYRAKKFEQLYERARAR
jgi:isopenicillin N synthase-like dioxygenase